MLIVFDMDGTVLDSMKRLSELAVGTMMLHYGVTAEEARVAYERTTGLPFAEQLNMIFPNSDQNNRVAEGYADAHRRMAGTFPMAPRLDKVFRWLKSHQVKLALVSSTSADIIAQMPQVHAAGFDYIGGFRGYEKDIQIEEACAYLGVPLTDVIYFGDAAMDQEYASRIGVQFVFTQAEHLADNLTSVLGSVL